MNAKDGDEVITTVPIIEEELHVGRTEVTTGRVRVRTTVHEDERVIDEPIRHKRLEVTRVPVERTADQPEPDRQDGDTLVISLCREIVTIQRKYEVYEEVRVRTIYEEERHREVVRLRRTEANVEND